MFTLNVDLFFSIPIPGFISSDRFAWNSPVRLPLISSVLLLLGKTKSFLFSEQEKNSLTGGTPHCAKKLYVTFPSDITGQ